QLPKGVSRARAVELRAKAQLAMQTASQLVRISSLSSATLDDILAATPDLTIDADLLERLQSQVGVLQVALDARWLRRRTMAEFLASRAPWAGGGTMSELIIVDGATVTFVPAFRLAT